MRNPVAAAPFYPHRPRRIAGDSLAEGQVMNTDQLEGSWEILKGKIQKQWGRLTNDDLDVIEGNRKEISGRIQQRYGYARERAEREVDTWLNSQ
jgi:uncharacterized protein YjbJ (UPF0337 family)